MQNTIRKWTFWHTNRVNWCGGLRLGSVRKEQDVSNPIRTLPNPNRLIDLKECSGFWYRLFWNNIRPNTQKEIERINNDGTVDCRCKCNRTENWGTWRRNQGERSKVGCRHPPGTEGLGRGYLTCLVYPGQVDSGSIDTRHNRNRQSPPGNVHYI